MQENFFANDTENLTCRVLKIRGCFYGDNCMPSLNNLLADAMRNPKAYNTTKRQMEFVVINAIRLQLRGYKAKKQVQLHFEFGERNKGQKRDYDNILASASKIICDALVKAGTLQDDAPKYLAPSTCEFHYVDKPYIFVTIKEVD